MTSSIIIATFQKQQEQYRSQYAAFWKWFSKYQKNFYNILGQGNREEIDANFFEPLAEKLSKIREGYYFLAGMDEDTAELIITADGEIKNIPFAEDLVAAAPEIKGWRFIASKQESEAAHSTINMEGYTFSLKNQDFYAMETPEYPDSINIVITHKDYTETPAIANTIIQGVYLFLDNYLGELESISLIDSVTVQNPAKADKELIPIEKLKSYLAWPQKEFIEKYEDVWYNEENDNYAMLTAQSEAGNPVMIMVNTGAMEWEHATSYPWILKIRITYDGEDTNGLPGSETNKQMDAIEDDLLILLSNESGHMYLGRETYECNRRICIACRDFRYPSRAAETIIKQYSDQLEIEYNIYRDPYRLTLGGFKSENWVEAEGDEED